MAASVTTVDLFIDNAHTLDHSSHPQYRMQPGFLLKISHSSSQYSTKGPLMKVLTAICLVTVGARSSSSVIPIIANPQS
jgi:hypothetical protein